MINILKQFNLTVVDTHGFKVNFEKYDIVDFSYIEKTDVFHRTLKRVITAEEYLTTLLNKGYGIFLNGKVYYKVNLIPEIINIKKKNLENYIANQILLAEKDRYRIQKYLAHPKHELFVRNAIQFYERGFDLDFVKKRLDGRVKDVDEFLLYLKNRKNRIAG